MAGAEEETEEVVELSTSSSATIVALREGNLEVVIVVCDVLQVSFFC